jgi:hypothetical protein
MGHMLNNTIQDVLVRKARMEGKNACWVPGTDHASIATEAKVVNLLKSKGIEKTDLTREDFLTHAWEWKEKYGGIILEQLKKLGASCDWDRTRFTMESKLSDAVRDVFIDLFEKGLIYRGTRMVNWDPQGKTTLSDEEVIFKEVKDALYYIKYEGVDFDGTLEIATARPETIAGDVAVCVNPNDERYAHLLGKKVRVPLVNREVTIISDDYIDANDAQKMEACTIESYRSNGWKILNKAKAGSLGTCRLFWTKERVKELTKKLSTWKEFSKHKGAFDSAYRNGWLDDQDITGHLLKVRKEYDEQSIWNTIKQINSYEEFISYDNNRLYQAAKARDMLDDIAEYYGYKMKKKYDEHIIWDIIKQEQFNNYGEFRNYDNKRLYGAARERNMIDDIKKYFNPNISDQTMQ